MNESVAYDSVRVNKFRMGVMIYQLLAGLFYFAGEVSLIPPYRLQALTESTALDFFPDWISFILNAILAGIFLITWQIYAWGNYKQLNPLEMIFQYKVESSTKFPRHAWFFPTGMILFAISEQMLPFIRNPVNPWAGFAICLVALGFLMFVSLSTMPELMKNDPSSIDVKVRMMVKAYALVVTVWCLLMTFVWLLHAVDMYMPVDASTKANANSPSPSPTEFHQKTGSQVTGMAFMLITTALIIMLEIVTRAYLGIIVGLNFMSFVILDDHYEIANSQYTVYTGITCLVILVIAFLIIVPVSEIVCMPKLKKKILEQKDTVVISRLNGITPPQRVDNVSALLLT